MKNLLFSFILLTGTFPAFSVDFEVRASKTAALLNFLETLTGATHTSQTLQQYIAESPEVDAGLVDLAVRFSRIDLDIPIGSGSELEGRPAERNVKDLIKMAAVKSDGVEEFADRITGMLAEAQRTELLSIMKAAAPYYDKIIWNGTKDSIADKAEKLKEYVPQMTKAFEQLNHFYRGQYPSDQDFVVCIYPIPGNQGHTTATPHGNTLLMGAFTEGKDFANRTGVAVHELCHILYRSQSEAFQWELENWFLQNTSQHARLAYSYFDEALATACGNGWAYEKLTGETEEGDWYAEPYTNGFGQALYPLVDEYLNEGSELDSAFVNSAIEIFAKAFPDAIRIYSLLINHASLYHDGEDAAERNAVHQALSKRFPVSAYWLSVPILSDGAKERLKTADGTHVVLIYKKNAENLSYLKQEFWQLAGTEASQDFYASFYDEQSRPVVIVNAQNMNSLELLLDTMQKAEKLDPAKPVHLVEG